MKDTKEKEQRRKGIIGARATPSHSIKAVGCGVENNAVWRSILQRFSSLKVFFEPSKRDFSRASRTPFYSTLLVQAYFGASIFG